MGAVSLEQLPGQSSVPEEDLNVLMEHLIGSVPEGRHDLDSELAAVSIIKKISAARSSVQVIERNLENGSRKSFYIEVSNNSNALNPVTAGCNTWDPRLGGRTGGVEVSGDYVESHEGRKKDPAAARVVKEAILGKISNAAAGIRL